MKQYELTIKYEDNEINEIVPDIKSGIKRSFECMSGMFDENYCKGGVATLRECDSKEVYFYALLSMGPFQHNRFNQPVLKYHCIKGTVIEDRVIDTIGEGMDMARRYFNENVVNEKSHGGYAYIDDMVRREKTYVWMILKSGPWE